MAYTFLNMQSKLSTLLADSNVGTDDAFPTAVRLKELNRGEMAFCKDSKSVLEYATGTISSGQLAIPSDWLETHILIINSQRLDPSREISIQDYERFYNYTGSPPYYYYWEFSGTRYLKFFGSVNGQTYLWYYFKKPTTDLSGDSDTSIVRDEYREAIVYYAAAELMEQLGKHAISDKYRALYFNIVREAQMQVERLYTTQIYPNPDFNLVGGATTDIQGVGW
jgi:hypothetical protein